MSEKPLNQLLGERGYTTRPAAPGRKDVLDRSGVVLLSRASAVQVSAWLAGQQEEPATPGPEPRKLTQVELIFARRRVGLPDHEEVTP